MPDHIQITFSDLQPEQQEILIAHLAEIGFDGFEEREGELDAFIPEANYNETLLGNLIYKYQLNFRKEIIPEKNWNQVWESHFQPVIIDDFVAVRADFHPPVAGVQHEILITPKMSFGTGHHATTRMMIRQMREIQFQSKNVFDFGTGTGILSILAVQLGAAKVVSMDIDDWSIENAKDNFHRNGITCIELVKASVDSLTGDFNVILANINKNVILENLDELVRHLQQEGTLLISGILSTDEKEILQAVKKHHLHCGKTLVETNWVCMRFDHIPVVN